MKNNQINMAPEPGQAAVKALIAGFANVNIEMEEEDDGRIIAEISALPGCLVYAESREEAVRKVQALALRVIADKVEHGEFDIRQLGSGDYTKERQAVLDANSIDMIAERIKKRKEQQG